MLVRGDAMHDHARNPVQFAAPLPVRRLCLPGKEMHGNATSMFKRFQKQVNQGE